MASNRPGAYTGAVKFPPPKAFYVLSQVADSDGDLSWCIVDSAGDADTAEASRQAREDYITGRDIAEARAAEADGREPVHRHSLFVTFSRDELTASGLGHLIGRP